MELLTSSFGQFFTKLSSRNIIVGSVGRDDYRF